MNPDFQSEESTLVRQAREGSTAAFGVLVHRCHARVFGFLLALTRHRQDAEDLTQDTFLRAWRKFHRFDPELPLLPWLFTIARRQSIAALRRSRPPAMDPEPVALDPATPASDRSAWLWETARRTLPADAYSALWLHYREELPVKQIATVLAKREGAVKVILHRARKSLSDAMRGRSAASDPPLLATPQHLLP